MGISNVSRSNTNSGTGTASSSNIGHRRLIRAKRPHLVTDGKVNQTSDEEERMLLRKRSWDATPPELNQLGFVDIRMVSHDNNDNMQANKRLRQDYHNACIPSFSYAQVEPMRSINNGHHYLATTPRMHNLSGDVTMHDYLSDDGTTATTTTTTRRLPVNLVRTDTKRFRGNEPPPVYPPAVQTKMNDRAKFNHKIRDYQRRIADIYTALTTPHSIHTKATKHKRSKTTAATATTLFSIEQAGMMAKRDKLTQKMQAYQQHVATLSMEINLALHGSYFHSSS